MVFVSLYGDLFVAEEVIQGYVEEIWKQTSEWNQVSIPGDFVVLKSTSDSFDFPTAWVLYQKGKKYLVLNHTMCDVIESVVYDPQATHYTLKLVNQKSSYMIMITFPKSRIHQIILSCLQHELGHLYYKDHSKFDRWEALVGVIWGAAWVGGTIWKMYNDNKKDGKAWKASELDKGLLESGIILTGSGIYMLWNSTSKTSLQKEIEADAFVSSYPALLYNRIARFKIAELEDIYLHSYNSSWAKNGAWWNKVDVKEYVKNNPEKAYRLHGFLQTHPSHQTRYTKYQERLHQLQPDGYAPAEYISVKVYNGTECVYSIEL